MTGDWNCDGVATPALLQPSGAVYLVDQWVDGSRSRYVVTVPGAIDLRVDHGSGCDVLAVLTATGETVTPELRAA